MLLLVLENHERSTNNLTKCDTFKKIETFCTWSCVQPDAATHVVEGSVLPMESS